MKNIGKLINFQAIYILLSIVNEIHCECQVKKEYNSIISLFEDGNKFDAQTLC